MFTDLAGLSVIEGGLSVDLICHLQRSQDIKNEKQGNRKLRRKKGQLVPQFFFSFHGPSYTHPLGKARVGL